MTVCKSTGHSSPVACVRQLQVNDNASRLALASAAALKVALLTCCGGHALRALRRGVKLREHAR